MSQSEATELTEDGDQEGETATKKERLKEKLGADTVKKGKPPMVSFRSNGTIAPNKRVTKQHLQGVCALSFLYQEEENTLIIIPLEEYDEEADDEYSVGDEENNTNSVTAKPLYDKIGMDLESTHRYTPTWDEEMGVLKIDLDEDPEVYTPDTTDSDDD